MGNAGSNSRERHKSCDLDIISPHRDSQSQAFIFDKNSENSAYQEPSNEEDESYCDKQHLSVDDPALHQHSSTDGTDKSGLLPTVFKWEGGGKDVAISGTFSNWKPVPMVKSHGDFVTIIDLPEGEHEYKFCIDGEWKCDPTNKIIDNGLGSKNNVVTVKNTDFEVFQALDMDSENSSSSNQASEYSQEIPALQKPWERMHGPPILPPHLLQIILNKDTPLSCEPTLLPEPNHVMLNHLYALSIKDGVMVLSATHRYRKNWSAVRGKPLPPKCEYNQRDFAAVKDKYSNWKEFLKRRFTRARTVPSNFYSKVHDSMKSRFRCNLTVEVVDKDRISQVKVAIIDKIMGKRLSYDTTIRNRA